MLSWLYPWFFLLLPLPLLLRRRGRKQGSSPAQAPQMPLYPLLADLPGVQRSRPAGRALSLVLLALAWCALVTAMARPQWVGEPLNLPVTGRDLMLAVDISPSMEEQDMIVNRRRVSRLTAVKHVVSEFIDQRTGDRVGLILFGTRPYIQAPLTFDHRTVKRLLNEAALGMAGRATSIGDAIGLAIRHLKDRPASQRVLILLSDGANTAGELPPEKAAEIAAQSGIRIYTIAIGGEGRSRGLFGLGQRREVDEDLLRQIARRTQGQFFRASNTPELQLVYERIDQMEPIEQEGGVYRPRKDLFYGPLALSVLLVLLPPLAAAAGQLLRREGRPDPEREVRSHD